MLLNVFALLAAKKVSQSTVAMVMDIAESLLTTPDFLPSEKEAELTVNGVVVPEPGDGSDIAAGTADNTQAASLWSSVPENRDCCLYLGQEMQC